MKTECNKIMVKNDGAMQTIPTANSQQLLHFHANCNCWHGFMGCSTYYVPATKPGKFNKTIGTCYIYTQQKGIVSLTKIFVI